MIQKSLVEYAQFNEADINNDGIIDRDELGIFINKWINGEASREALGMAITIWASQ